MPCLTDLRCVAWVAFRYGLAIAMAREATDFLFFEMDCWMLSHPLRAVDTHPIHADLYMSLHQVKGPWPTAGPAANVRVANGRRCQHVHKPPSWGVFSLPPLCWYVHQDNPFEFNVGYYYVRASDPKVAMLKPSHVASLVLTLDLLQRPL